MWKWSHCPEWGESKHEKMQWKYKSENECQYFHMKSWYCPTIFDGLSRLRSEMKWKLSRLCGGGGQTYLWVLAQEPVMSRSLSRSLSCSVGPAGWRRRQLSWGVGRAPVTPAARGHRPETTKISVISLRHRQRDFFLLLGFFICQEGNPHFDPTMYTHGDEYVMRGPSFTSQSKKSEIGGMWPEVARKLLHCSIIILIKIRENEEIMLNPSFLCLINCLDIRTLQHNLETLNQSWSHMKTQHVGACLGRIVHDVF